VISVRHINHHVVHTVPIATAASKATIITVFGWEHVRLVFVVVVVVAVVAAARLFVLRVPVAHTFFLVLAGIGKKNYKQFVRFNLSWLVHLVYAVLWVSLTGPIVYRNKEEDKDQ
jgi:hypothetical protein